MNTIGKAERITQNRVVKLFCEELGHRYLGDWSERKKNSNLDEALAAAHLMRAGHSAEHISRALCLLRSLYENNKAVYELLRHGVQVKTEAGKVTVTVRLID